MEAEYEKKIAELRSKIKSFADFPKKGILFCILSHVLQSCVQTPRKSYQNISYLFIYDFVQLSKPDKVQMKQQLLSMGDIFSAISDGGTCTLLQSLLVHTIKTKFPGVEAVIGLESRGFLFAFSLAAELGLACIPVRKKGKLPGQVISLKYDLEYGSDILEIQKDIIRPGLKCLIIDDLIATGGSISAAVNLLQMCKAEVTGCLLVIELEGLRGRNKIPEGIPVHSLLKYD